MNRTPAIWSFAPSVRTGVILGALALPLLIVPVWPMMSVLVIALDAVVLTFVAADYFWLKRSGLEAQRTLDERLSVGTDNPVELRVKNNGDMRLRLEVRDEFPAVAPPTMPEARTLGPVSLAGGATHKLEYDVHPQSRGQATFGAIHCRARSPLGLAEAIATVPVAQDVQIYPNIRKVHQVELASRLRDLQRLGLRNVRLEGGGGEFAKLRDYVQGDQYKDINWKATARKRKPVIQVYESERRQNLMLCIDAGLPMASSFEGVTKLDHAINAALLLAFVALSSDDCVGLLVVSDQVDVYLPPRKGQAHYRRILEALYAIQPRHAYVDYNTMVKEVLTRLKRRSLVVLFTDLSDELAAEPLVTTARALYPKHLPLVVTQRDEMLHSVINRVPDSPEEVFECAVATEVLHARETMKTKMQRRGARVIEHEPGELSVATINAYAELKQRLL